jgi:phage major head subunit gpT-like protein
MQLTPSLLQAFFTALDVQYQRGYQKRRTYWQDYAWLSPSGTENKTYSWLAELPGMREWIGEKQVKNLSARAFQIVNKNWENTFGVDRNKIEDDEAGIYSQSAMLQGDVVARWPDDLVTAALIAGTTTLGYDGSYYFSNNHPVDVDDGTQGTYSNLLTGTALTQANYAAAKAAMRSFKGESGKPLQVLPTMMMVGPSLEQTALEVTKAQNITRIVQNVAGLENVAAAAPTNVYYGDVTLVVNERLVDDTANAWYIFSTDRIKPFIFQQRKAPTRVQIIDPTNPLVFNQRQYAYSVEARGAAGFGLPFLSIKCTP